MSLKKSTTTCDYLEFDKTLNMSMKILKNEKNYKIAFLIIVGINSGLRISDILGLHHRDLSGDSLQLVEKKTKKPRTIDLNENIKNAYKLYCNRLKHNFSQDDSLFISQKHEVFSIRSVNRELKRILGDSNRKLKISSHSLRKTFGRRVFLNNNESEKSLIFLSAMFNHSDVSTTRLYLGIRQEELREIYLNL